MIWPARWVMVTGYTYSTVGAILIVSCFGIYNVISTVVFEKTRDIGILKSMGFRDSDIRRIFVLEGLMVGIVGTVLGWLLGWALVEALASVRFDLEGFIKSQGFILYRSSQHYIIGAAMAITSATLAAWIPARRASQMKPVDIVRGAG